MKKIILTAIMIFSINGLAQDLQPVAYENEQLLQSYRLNQVEENYKPDFQIQDQQREKKSLGKAFLYSMLLPGLGEAYVGNTTYTKIFLSLEAVGWGFLIGNYQHVSWLEKDYKNYAYQHANISKDQKEDQYWIDIGKFDNIYQYNEQRRRDRDETRIYDENEYYNWRWDAHSNRLSYDAKRIHAKQLENDDIYYMGAIVLNHLVSAINALRLAKAYNRNLKEAGWIMGVKFDKYRNSLSLSVSQSF